MSNSSIFLPFITYMRFFCMLIEVSSRICFHHVAKCFQDDSQIQDQMLWHLQCRHCIIWIWSVFLPSEVSATDQRMRQSVAESLSLSQNKRLLLYQTLWECLMCHYSNIYPLLPMNLSTDLSIRRQRNPLCPKIFLFLVELDMCRVWVASLFLMFMFFCCSDASALYYSRQKLLALTRDLRFLPPVLIESSNS